MTFDDNQDTLQYLNINKYVELLLFDQYYIMYDKVRVFLDVCICIYQTVLPIS